MAGVGGFCLRRKMLDADSLFERLLREAANLVPKMSTPKLTNALKVTSSLQQRITDTVASRLPQEKSGEQVADQNRHQVSTENALSQSMLPGATLFSTSEINDQVSRTISNQMDGNYSGITIFPQLNHLSNNNNKDSSDVVSSSEISIFSPMNTVTAVMSSGAGMGGCGALLVPLVAGGHGTAILHPNSTITSSASHLSVVADPSFLMNSNVTSMGGNTINFISSSCANSLSTNSSTRDSNLKQEVKNESTNSEQNGQILVSKDSLELKPEPLDCFGRVRIGTTETILSSNPNDISTGEYSQLPPIVPFTLTPTTMTISSPISTSITLNRTTTTTTANSNMGTVTSTDVNNSSTVEATSTSTSKTTSNSGPYRCRECDKEFRILRYLEKHRRIHTGEKPYQCCYCGRQFNDWPNMNRHKRIHTGERPYHCTVCAKTFSQPAVYNEHVKRHTGERPYICSVCAKGFPRAARLAVHMRVHTGERPYPCTSCDRRFSQPHHLAAHLRVHSGDRPYSCPKCDVSFACISNLRRHRKQVHPTSPIGPSENSECSDMKSLTDEKKPSLQNLAVSTSGAETICSSTGVALGAPSFLVSSSNLTADTPVAIAAAMSGTVLTATGALVPANFLPASSIPGLILTSPAPGALIAAAPAHLTDQHQHLHPALIAHNSGHQNMGTDVSTTTLLATSLPGSLGTLNQPSHTSSVSMGTHSEALFKASSSTMSLMFPTVLTSSPHGDALRSTSVAFLTPTGEIDRSCAALATTGPDGGLVVNPVGGDTVYLEPLDPRLTIESGHQFTLTTIPTSHPHGSATILNPHHSGTHLLGHQVQLQAGQHATHIAFATNLPTQGQHGHHLLAHNPTIFSSNPNSGQTTIHTNPSPATVIFPPPSAVPQTSLSNQQQSVLQTQSETATPSQLLHYHRPISTAGILPGRPASTPTQQQTTMLVPIVHTPPVSGTSTIPTPTSDPGESVTTIPITSSWPVSGTFLTLTSSHLCPVSSSANLHDEHVDSTNLANSRPSSVLSNSSSLGPLTTSTVPETSM